MCVHTWVSLHVPSVYTASGDTPHPPLQTAATANTREGRQQTDTPGFTHHHHHQPRPSQSAVPALSLPWCLIHQLSLSHSHLKSNLWIRKQPGDSPFYQIMSKWSCACIVYICQKPLSPFKTRKRSLHLWASVWLMEINTTLYSAFWACMFTTWCGMHGHVDGKPSSLPPAPCAQFVFIIAWRQKWRREEHLGDGCAMDDK